MKLARTRVSLAASSVVVAAAATVLVSEVLLSVDSARSRAPRSRSDAPHEAPTSPSAVSSRAPRPVDGATSRDPTAASGKDEQEVSRQALDRATDALRRPGSSSGRALALRTLAVTVDGLAVADRTRAVALGLEALSLESAESDPELSLAASALLEQLSTSVTHSDLASGLRCARTATSRVVFVRLLGLSASHDDRAIFQLRLASKDADAEVRAEAIACLLEAQADEDLCRGAVDELAKVHSHPLERALASTHCAAADEALSRRFAATSDRAELDRLARVLMARGRRRALEPYALGPEPWASAASIALEHR